MTQANVPRTARPTRGILFVEPLIFERSRPGREGFSVPEVPPDVPVAVPAGLLRDDGLAGLPEVSEPEVVRHFVRLSQWNYSIDHGMYPLGSCTMKYNPKINEHTARLTGLADLHPYLPEDAVQGALQLIWELERYLGEIAGLPAVTLQPAAGAHGEFTGVAMIRAALSARGDARRKVLIPETAHGTNPASCSRNDYKVVEVRSNAEGVVDPDDVARKMDDQTAAIMLTNPNTLGLFESHIARVAEIVHARGGFVYGDGANMNSLLGRARPGDLGVDVMQYNLHKTFSTPHGGGGPGSGPVAVCAALEPFLPLPRVERVSDGQGERFCLVQDRHDRPQSIGRVKAFFGNFGMMVRAYTYIRELGPDGLKQATDMAVLNANYLRVRLRERFHLAIERPCMHEVVLDDHGFKKLGIKTMDVAKRLIDHGFHPPTIYFPLCVSGALMIEPTETETLETLDRFVESMFAVLDEAERAPDQLHAAPQLTGITRVDEVQAARQPVLRWTPEA
jgi:glycine dehydrogenase subunit 2